MGENEIKIMKGWMFYKIIAKVCIGQNTKWISLPDWTWYMNIKSLPTTAPMFNSWPNTQLSGGKVPVSLEKPKNYAYTVEVSSRVLKFFKTIYHVKFEYRYHFSYL